MPDVPKAKVATQDNAAAGPTLASYRFSSNPAMSRGWLRNLVFGLALALPLALFGLGAELWLAKDLWFVFGIPVVTSMVLLPIYAAIVRELG